MSSAKARMLVAFKLLLLEHAVRDGHFERITDDIAQVIRSSEDACQRAADSGDEDFYEAVIFTEADYIEELLGAFFLMLQGKIRRVCEAAKEVSEMLASEHGLSPMWLQASDVRKHGATFNGTTHTQVELVWAIGNYYKHRDEWAPNVWTPHGNRQSVATRTIVEKVGVQQSSTGNMRKAIEFFGVNPYSNCVNVAKDVQSWAESVDQHGTRTPLRG